MQKFLLCTIFSSVAFTSSANSILKNEYTSQESEALIQSSLRSNSENDNQTTRLAQNLSDPKRLKSEHEGSKSNSLISDIGKTVTKITIKEFSTRMSEEEVKSILSTAIPAHKKCQIYDTTIENSEYVFGDSYFSCNTALTYFNQPVIEAEFFFLKGSLIFLSFRGLNESSESPSPYPPIINALTQKFGVKPIEKIELQPYTQDRGIIKFIWINKSTGDAFQYISNFSKNRSGGIDFTGVELNIATDQYPTMVEQRTKEREEFKAQNIRKIEEQRKGDM